MGFPEISFDTDELTLIQDLVELYCEAIDEGIANPLDSEGTDAAYQMREKMREYFRKWNSGN